MSYMFSDAIDFNDDISQWDVSQVTDMHRMFAGAAAFNQDIGQWPIRRDCHINTMFYKSGMSAETFKGIYGRRIADYFKLKNPDEDAVWELYTRRERRINAAIVCEGLNKKDREGTLSTPEEQHRELCRMVLDSDGVGREIVSYLGGSKN